MTVASGSNETKELWLGVFRTMLIIRRFEETVVRLNKRGVLPGFVHVYIGEEAGAVGVCSTLQDDDIILSNHRPHGHCLARGTDPYRLFAELYGRADGLCKGKSGSMHIVDLAHGVFGANGIVGAGTALALGPALYFQQTKQPLVSVVFFGDGASNAGAVHESMNLASVWKLPVVYVCENDGYGEATPREFHQAVGAIATRAGAYAMEGVTVDGQDVMAVRETAERAVARARAGEGPTLVELNTYRYRGHFEGDPGGYRSENEVEEHMARDAILRLRKALKNDFGASESDLESIELDVSASIEEAQVRAEASDDPHPASAFTDVYASSYGG